MRSHSSSVMSPCVVRHVLLGCSGVFVMNISIVVASAPLVANGPFRSANFRNSLLELPYLGAPTAVVNVQTRKVTPDIVSRYSLLRPGMAWRPSCRVVPRPLVVCAPRSYSRLAPGGR